MTKARIAITIAIVFFTAFTVLGFFIARGYGRSLSVTKAASSFPSPDPASQFNVLVIHVDDLQQPDPQLVSVWIIMAAHYDSPYLSFKSLYPDPLSLRPPVPLQVLFSLDEQGIPSEAFMKWINDFRINMSGYVILDNSAFEQVGGWLTGEQMEWQNILPRNKGQFQKVFLQEGKLFETICTNISVETMDNRQPLRWSELIPNHFRTDMSFESMAVNWDKIASAAQQPHCEVVGLN
jgi:hypothetical protein